MMITVRLISSTLTLLSLCQPQAQGLPCTASQPSRRITGTMTNAAAGSAHLMCQTMFMSNPNKAREITAEG